MAIRARAGVAAPRNARRRETGGARAGGTVALRVAVVRARSPHRARAIIARRTRCAHFWSRGLSRLYRFVPFSRVCTDLDLTPLFFSSKMRPSNSPCFCCCRLMRRFGAFGRVVRQQRVAGVSDGGRPKTCFLVCSLKIAVLGSKNDLGCFLSPVVARSVVLGAPIGLERPFPFRLRSP